MYVIPGTTKKEIKNLTITIILKFECLLNILTMFLVSINGSKT